MKHLLKITLVASASLASVTINAPVSAGNPLTSLRGMFAPQASHAEFEGRFDKSQTYATPRQQRRLQAAAPAQETNYYASNGAQNSYTQIPQGQEETVRYYNAEDYYAQKQHSGQNEFEGHFSQSASQNTTWQERRLRTTTYPQSYGSPHRTAENNYPRDISQKQRQSKRAKYGNIYDYERGHCGKECASAPVQTYYRPAVQPVTYRQITEYRCWDGSIVADANSCAPQTITQSIPQYKCWDGEVVTDVDGCKRQTITQEVSRTRDTAYGSSYQTSAPTDVECPSGTSKQSDGTCLQFSSQSSSIPTTSYGSTSTYSGSNYSSLPTNCPSGTTAQSDGTCMEVTSSYDSNPFAGASVELFGGNTSTNVTPSYSYETTNNIGLRSYRPIRK